MRELKKFDLNSVVFLDIETARLTDELDVDSPLWNSWEYKKSKVKDFDPINMEESYKKEASLYPEFSKIVCISTGKIVDGVIKVHSRSGCDEKEILQDVMKDFESLYTKDKNTRICTFAGIGFDIPFIMKRCLANRVNMHSAFDVTGLKPWETSIIDMSVIWNATSFTRASFLNVCVALGVDSPKTDIDGSKVSDLYWSTNGGDYEVKRITNYCESDVRALAEVVLVCKGEEIPKKIGKLEQLYHGAPLEDEDMERIKDIVATSNGVKESLELLGSLSRKKKTNVTKEKVKKMIPGKTKK